MWIIGCDYHPSFQQIAFVNQATGEYDERRLEHKGGEAEQFHLDAARAWSASGIMASFSQRCKLS